MEQITYRKTLDVHKNGVQFMLQGFETADNLSRVIEISLMASGDAIDFPLERIEAMMYVTTPNATEPSINKCTIKDNKIIYDVLPIVREGITTMQLKIIETSPEGAKRVLASPKFAVEVTKSNADDESTEQSTTFTALEDAIAKAKTVYDERFLRMELTSDCIFKAYYADGTYYETDLLKKLFHNGNSVLAESFAKGGTGVRANEDIDNSMYYSNIARSEALNAQSIMKNSNDVLDEVRLHGVYTAFSVDFETGEVEYVSPSFKFNINLDTGELDAQGQTYSFNGEVERVVKEWLEANNLNLNTLQDISLTHSGEIKDLKETTGSHAEEIDYLKNERVNPVDKGGTGATTPEEAILNLKIHDYVSPIPLYLTFAGNVNANMVSAAFGKGNEDGINGVGKALAMYAWFKGTDKAEYPLLNLQNMQTLNDMNFAVYDEIINNSYLSDLIKGNSYAFDKVFEKYTVKTDMTSSIPMNTTRTATVDFSIGDEDLQHPFSLSYNIHDDGEHYISSGYIAINGVNAISSGGGSGTNIVKEWRDFNITTPGTYTMKVSITVTGYQTSISPSSAYGDVTMLKAKQSYDA